MQGKLLATAAIAALFAVPAFAQTWKDSVDVETDLAAIQSPEAAQRYANLDDDLTTAIVALLEQRAEMGDGGNANIKVDVDEVSLAAPFMGNGGVSSSALSGKVIVDVRGGTQLSPDNYTLTVSMDQAMPYIPANMDVTVMEPSSDEIYNALIQAFAANVVSKLYD
ncbi:hypothetical protein [Falsirhodobacter halotolerans]|uniref:hypothetical protein n=1 Tax=Falsirhodobacter halotolerans TaxID=1146892 RepID=UPI001FD2C368|nr:hypothetical protein [Falsirhodobacter halotolerans]MCJ8140750.1 hypothetical protein [Falsirhodobacter halotolerans]